MSRIAKPNKSLKKVLIIMLQGDLNKYKEPVTKSYKHHPKRHFQKHPGHLQLNIPHQVTLVFLPMPGKRSSCSWTELLSICRRNSMEVFPCSWIEKTELAKSRLAALFCFGFGLFLFCLFFWANWDALLKCLLCWL